MLVLYMRGKKCRSGRQRGRRLTVACVSGCHTMFCFFILLKISNLMILCQLKAAKADFFFTWRLVAAEKVPSSSLSCFTCVLLRKGAGPSISRPGSGQSLRHDSAHLGRSQEGQSI